VKGLIRKDTLQWIYRKIRRRIPAMLLLTVCTAVSACLAVSFALVTRELIDGASWGDQSRIIHACVALVLLVAARTGFSVLGIHVSDKLAYDMDRDFKKSLFHTILNGNYADIAKYHTGDLIVRINGDASQVHAGILGLISSLTGLLTSLVTAMIMLGTIASGFMVLMVLGSAVIAIFMLLIQHKMKQLQKQSAVAGGKVTGFIQEAVSRLLIVQALDVSGEMEKRADVLLEEKWQIQRKRKNIKIFMNTGSSLLTYAGSLVALIWCVSELYQGRITFGTLTATTQLVGQLQGPLMGLPKLIPKVVAIATAAERLMELDDIPAQEASDPGMRKQLYDSMSGITAEALSFAYDRDNVLDHMDFTIPKEGLTVITGVSGVGKSTILKLLLGIYRPNGGGLYVNTEAGRIPVSRATRCLFSYAPQGNLLLSGTLRENLLLSRPEATPAELQEALYVSALDGYVATLPNGLDTVLRENSAGMSEGQAQRLSLARAVLSGAPILLLDEVTSSLDGETERVVLARIRNLKDRTCIVVTHRPAILSLADYRLDISERAVTLTALK
jgi:ATP-binding cassette subfamily B protein